MQSRRKRLVRVAAVIGIALGAGHLAQRGESQAAALSVGSGPVPVSVVPLAASLDADLQRPEPPQADLSLPLLPEPAARPVAAVPARLAVPTALAEPDDGCTSRLGLSARPGAMIDFLLTSPCRPGERVVLRHAGLAVTYRINSAGALMGSFPALNPDAAVSVLFSGGETVGATLDLPEAAAFQRFGVQWMGPQAFAVNAFENGADYAMPGHVSAVQPQRPSGALMPDKGFLTVLGDDQVELPMLAEIYTFPADRNVPIVVEAAVTPETCGHEILGESLNAIGGVVRVSDLSVTMPACDAVGDYLVLKNLVPDLKLASAN